MLIHNLVPRVSHLTAPQSSLQGGGKMRDPGSEVGSSIAVLISSIYYTSTHFVFRGGKRHCEDEVSFPRIQHGVTSQGSNPDCWLRNPVH